MLKVVLFLLTITSTISFNANAIGKGSDSQLAEIQALQCAVEKYNEQVKKEAIVAEYLTRLYLDCIPPFLRQVTGDRLYHLLIGRFDYTGSLDDETCPVYKCTVFTPEGTNYGGEKEKIYFDIFSERVVSAISFLIIVNREIPLADYCVLFSNLLWWCGIARAAVAMLNNPSIDYMNYKSISLFGAPFENGGALIEPWCKYSKYHLVLFECLSNKTPIEECRAEFVSVALFGNKEQKTTPQEFSDATREETGILYHSKKTAHVTAIEAFTNIFMLVRYMATLAAHDEALAPSLSDALKHFIYSMSWSSTYERGQGGITLWLARSFCRALGLELVLQRQSAYAEALMHEAADFDTEDTSPTEIDHPDVGKTTFTPKIITADFLMRVFFNPDAFALFMPDRASFLRAYPAIGFKKRPWFDYESKLFNRFSGSPHRCFFPTDVHLSLFTLTAIHSFLTSRTLDAATVLTIKDIGSDYDQPLFSEILRIIPEKFPDLKHLSLIPIDDVTYRLSGSVLLDFDSHACRRFEKLETLFVRKCVLSAVSLDFIEKCMPTVHSLNLSVCGVTLFDGLDSFFPAINSLSFSYCEIFQESLHSILRCTPNLRELSISSSTISGCDFLNFNTQDIFKDLEKICLVSQRIDLASLYCASKQMPALRHVDISGCVVEIAPLVRKLQGAKKIKTFDISQVIDTQGKQWPVSRLTQLFLAESVSMKNDFYSVRDIAYLSQAGTVEIIISACHEFNFDPRYREKTAECGWTVRFDEASDRIFLRKPDTCTTTLRFS